MTKEKISKDTLERLVKYDEILDRIKFSTSSRFLAREKLYEFFPELQEYRKNKQKEEDK